jgi:hypothetical protein
MEVPTNWFVLGFVEFVGGDILLRDARVTNSAFLSSCTSSTKATIGESLPEINVEIINVATLIF